MMGELIEQLWINILETQIWITGSRISSLKKGSKETSEGSGKS
jgi:hypothetical protein